jgi:hypothetical protein
MLSRNDAQKRATCEQGGKTERSSSGGEAQGCGHGSGATALIKAHSPAQVKQLPPASVNAVLLDIENGDEPIPLTELPSSNLIPKHKGRKPHASAIFRWATAGLRGVKMESARCGGAICTTKSAVMRFYAKLSGVPAVPDARTPARRARHIARIEAELAATGL